MPAKTLAEFVELARRSPGEFNFGNPGTGSSIDLTAQKLFQAANIKLTNIGYKGQPQALVDLMTNLMHFEIVSLALALPHIKDGKVKPLAVFTEKRVAGSARRADDRGGRIPASRLRPLVRHLRAGGDAGRAGRKDSRRHRQGAAKSRRAAQLAVADIPGKPMPLKDLAGLMQADYEKLTAGGEGFRDEAAVGLFRQSGPIEHRRWLARISMRELALTSAMLRTHFFTLLASILIEVSSILVVNASSTLNGFSMPR